MCVLHVRGFWISVCLPFVELLSNSNYCTFDTCLSHGTLVDFLLSLADISLSCDFDLESADAKRV